MSKRCSSNPESIRSVMISRAGPCGLAPERQGVLATDLHPGTSCRVLSAPVAGAVTGTCRAADQNIPSGMGARERLRKATGQGRRRVWTTGTNRSRAPGHPTGTGLGRIASSVRSAVTPFRARMIHRRPARFWRVTAGTFRFGSRFMSRRRGARDTGHHPRSSTRTG